MHNDLIARILSYAGKKRSEVNNPCITANEAIELANHIKKLEHTNVILAESHYRLRHELEAIIQEVFYFHIFLTVIASWIISFFLYYTTTP